MRWPAFIAGTQRLRTSGRLYASYERIDVSDRALDSGTAARAR